MVWFCVCGLPVAQTGLGSTISVLGGSPGASGILEGSVLHFGVDVADIVDVV